MTPKEMTFTSATFGARCLIDSLIGHWPHLFLEIFNTKYALILLILVYYIYKKIIDKKEQPCTIQIV